MVVTTPRVASAVAQNNLDQVHTGRSVSAITFVMFDCYISWQLLYSSSVAAEHRKSGQLMHDASFALQASQTTAQGLWLALGCGVIVGAAIYVGGPFAVAGSPLCILHAHWCIACSTCQVVFALTMLLFSRYLQNPCIQHNRRVPMPAIVLCMVACMYLSALLAVTLKNYMLSVHVCAHVNHNSWAVQHFAAVPWLAVSSIVYCDFSAHYLQTCQACTK